MYKIKRIVKDTLNNRRIYRHYRYCLTKDWDMEKIVPFTPAQRKDYIDYYRSFGFGFVDPSYAEVVTSVTGRYDRRYIPDDILNRYIDPIYPEIRNHWQNKAYQHERLPGVAFPENILRCVNGYYLDNEDNILSEAQAIQLLQREEEFVIKPSIHSGGGLNVAFYPGSQANAWLLRSYYGELVAQKVLEQSAQMASFNTTSVNTVKFYSFLYQGEVFILCSGLRVSSPGDRTDNISSSDAHFFVNVDAQGNLADFGYDRTTAKRYCAANGRAFSGVHLDFYSDCVDIIKKSHRKLLYFPIVSWDFAQKKDGSPVLIEYNLKWHTAADCQVLNGPLFGDLTEAVLREGAKRRTLNKGLCYR